MARRMIQLDQEKLNCSICLDLLKDPVTIPCGHNYCMSCIKEYWNKRDERATNICPQCRQNFIPRPALVKNTMLADLLEEQKKTGLKGTSSDISYAGPEDISCDFCTGIKVKASKTCLTCMASYCEQHLQPHYTVTPLKKHQLADATSKLQENICMLHDEMMKIFCRTDKQSICYHCAMSDHKGHDTVCAATERAERQTKLQVNQQKVQQRIQDTEKDIKVLQQRVEAINLSADEAVRKSEKFFNEMKDLIVERSCEVNQQIRSQQETEVRQAKDLEVELQQEIAKLRKKDNEMETLSHTEDHLHFLTNYPSVSQITDFSNNDLPSLCCFDNVAVAVSHARDKVQAVLTEEGAKIYQTVTEAGSLQAEPKTRAQFLRYSCQIILDPNTAHQQLSLSLNNTKATLLKIPIKYLSHPERFFERWQVLSKEGLTGRCYWEVEWSGVVYIAVAYKSIKRTGTINECGFGKNDKSWALICKTGHNAFRHKDISTVISANLSSRIGVYLDYRAGTLSFYSISDTMTLIHRVQTTFTQPLYPGFWLPETGGSTAKLCKSSRLSSRQEFKE